MKLSSLKFDHCHFCLISTFLQVDLVKSSANNNGWLWIIQSYWGIVSGKVYSGYIVETCTLSQTCLDPEISLIDKEMNTPM